MMTVRAPKVKFETRSRNVKRYVRAVVARKTLEGALLHAKAEETTALGACSGAHEAHALTILRSLGYPMARRGQRAYPVPALSGPTWSPAEVPRP